MATISNRTAGYNNCPHCNSLSVKNPIVAKEWDYEKNKKLEFTPDNISSRSNKKVWWVCSRCGHNWKTAISNRVNGSGCPHCNSQTSFPEQAIFYYVKKIFPDAINRYSLKGTEIDIFIPSENLGIEYDGVYYHKENIKKENKKDLFCKENNIQLYRIREKGLEKTDSAINIFRSFNDSLDDLNKCIKLLFEKLNIKTDFIIDSKTDELKIISQYMQLVKENSFGAKHPELLKEWDYEANIGIDPYSISEYSKIILNWICPVCNNKWQASASMRARGKKKCEYCNSLEAKHPELLKEWDYDKNIQLNVKPNMVSFSSGKIVWWKCKNNHEWQASIANRCKGTKCPYCFGQMVTTGVNDLKTLQPDLIKEWDYNKNDELGIKPENIRAVSGKKVWWICSKCGYNWESTIANRSKGRNCPICARKEGWNTRRKNSHN